MKKLSYIMLLCIITSCADPKVDDIIVNPQPEVADDAAQTILAKDESQAIKSPTFYADILPILSAGGAPRNYRCTVCHPSYAQAEVVANKRIIELIINSVESGYMPANGDKLQRIDIDTLKLWRRTGFQTGDKKARGVQ